MSDIWEKTFFECTTCKKWFHPQCQGLDLTVEELETATRVTCLTCYSGRGTRYNLGKKMNYEKIIDMYHVFDNNMLGYCCLLSFFSR